MLLARIAEKKAELEHLKELRDLSAAVAGQMEALEQKLSTLSDGTEGEQEQPFQVANSHLGGRTDQTQLLPWLLATGIMCCVPSTWLQVCLDPNGIDVNETDTRSAAQLAKPQGDEPLESEDISLPLPQTLVRIPTEHAPTLQAQADNVAETAESSMVTP